MSVKDASQKDVDKRENSEEPKRKPLRIEIKQRFQFTPIEETFYLLSKDLCDQINSIFRPVFSDYEGSKIDRDQQGRPIIILFFNHAEVPDGKRYPGVTKTPPDGGSNKNVSETLRRVRNRDSLLRNGDRYYLTEEAKELLDDFIPDISRNYKTGKVNWNNIVADVSKNNENSMFGQAMVRYYTQVSIVSPEKLLANIFGPGDDEGNPYVYDMKFLNSNNSNMYGPFYSRMFRIGIMRVHESEVVELANKWGYDPNAGFDIIR